MSQEKPTGEGEEGWANPSQETQELTSFVQKLLTDMQSKFQTISDSIVGRIDDMGKRIDDLEKSITDLMQTAGVDEDEKEEKGLSK
mmetsp:Transcript_15145/g.38268  ORF Transcript_15145/g.38268 Transcript_15145/m.38268 type:complete len:86 (-) Transcript_15145:162-419(-)|eukprot:CAMPEP_0113872892 /NCGR_PEP_ID=MMETSP0780_2-20120614/3468_1 /TAXON_ID=652834 /ORGANISM="Palpitomonas bilix" /LENGTH=85 /DNA_ID=CAMNT_0000858479 /DNA_START=53 /DNA_END=310 /DNA_ORIENTATION=- /assembly_acc=CAM_ASM_000599